MARNPVSGQRRLCAAPVQAVECKRTENSKNNGGLAHSAHPMEQFMSFGRKRTIFAASAAVMTAAAAIPMATGFAFETNDPNATEADTELLAEAGIEADTNFAESTIALDMAPEAEAPEIVEEAAPEPAEQTVAVNDTMDADLECLVKIVRHEAANQSRQGQLAVAQLVMNRVNSPRFPNSICAVAHQRGQFFNTHAYNPPRGDARWQTALEVSIDARNGISAPVVGDAIFYRAAYGYSAFHESRPRVAQIEDHIFYR